MKTILNKTHDPIRVPLPRGKVLHLGPNMAGQVSHSEIDHPPLQKLIAEGVIEVQADETAGAASRETDKGPQADTHGFHPPGGSPIRGDR